LYDPVTPFDKEKKFAVIRRLFDNQKISLRDRTTIMLTHDFQPVIDFVHGRFFNRFGLTTPVRAKWLQNEDGSVIEYDIDKEDLINVVELTRQVVCDNNNSIAVRIVNLRKYLELTEPNFSNDPLYHVL
jgi:hypothetical protein